MVKHFDTQTFNHDVYEIVSQIPRGKVLSYGDVAELAGWRGYSRHVGRALHDCPASSDIPCHRVVNSQGRLSPIFIEQRNRLVEEGVTFKPNGNVDMKTCAWKYMDVNIEKWN